MGGRYRDRVQNADGDTATVGLLLISGAIAALVVSPLLWIVRRAIAVEPSEAVALTTRRTTLEILGASVALMVTVTLFCTLIGVPLAFVTTRTDLPWKRFWTIAVALPLVIPSYIGAFAFVGTFGPRGEVDSLGGVSIPEIDGFSGAVLVITLYTYPYVFLTTRAALLSMDTSLVDAARTLDASRVDAFRRVTLPQIKPAIAAGALLAGLYAISDFGTPAFMRLQVFTFAIYDYRTDLPAYAALLSLQLLAVVAVVLAIEARIGHSDRSMAGSGRGSQLRLGAWKWPTMGAMALLAVVTIVVPIAIFARWVFAETGGDGSVYAFQTEWALHSVYLATLAAVVAACFAIPVGYAAARSSSVAARLFERSTYIGFAVPGIVLGLALVFFGMNYVPWLYQTIPLLVFAYVVRFLPQAVGTTRTATLQVDQSILEAARTLDAGPLERFRRVTLPLILPGIVAGAALVFLTTMKELPATLMLQPIGMETLVTIIWEAHGTAHYRYAALPALLLVVLSGISMLVILRQERAGSGNQ